MTVTEATRRSIPVIDAVAPPERLAVFRFAAGMFTLCYLVIRAPVYLELTERAADDFDGVGVLAPLPEPLPDRLVVAVVIATIVASASVAVGLRYRLAAPCLATGMLLLATFRGSWGQLLHFENLIVLHLAVLACAPAADAWSLDARRGRSASTATPSVRYGWPLALAGLVTVLTYVIAGIAKLRYGGIDWIVGDTLRHHIAYSATRLDLIGGTTPPLAGIAVRSTWLLTVGAAIAVAIELAAPIALLGGRPRTAWVVAAWSMHVAILLTMSVGFPSPLFGLAFAPFFALERLVPSPLAARLAR